MRSPAWKCGCSGSIALNVLSHVLRICEPRLWLANNSEDSKLATSIQILSLDAQLPGSHYVPLRNVHDERVLRPIGNGHCWSHLQVH